MHEQGRREKETEKERRKDEQRVEGTKKWSKEDAKVVKGSASRISKSTNSKSIFVIWGKVGRGAAVLILLPSRRTSPATMSDQTAGC
jgi:hypothetical protein